MSTDSVRSGFQLETSTVVEVSLEPGFSVPDPAALGEYLLHVAWSAETKEANWRVRVQVLSDPQVSMVDALYADGWKSKSGNQKRPERASVRADEVKDRFGDWPGEVPELPESLILGPTSAPAP